MPPECTIAFQKLIQIENRYRRQPIEEVDMLWNPDTVADTEDIFVTVHTPLWNPRPPIKSKQNWNPRTRRLLHVCVKISYRKMDFVLFRFLQMQITN